MCDRSRGDVPCDEKGGVRDRIGADADMTLLDELCGLGGVGACGGGTRGHVLR